MPTRLPTAPPDEPLGDDPWDTGLPGAVGGGGAQEQGQIASMKAVAAEEFTSQVLQAAETQTSEPSAMPTPSTPEDVEVPPSPAPVTEADVVSGESV